MLNEVRIALYTRDLTHGKTVDGIYRLTPAQRRRVKGKQRAHEHYPEEACGRCRPASRSNAPIG